MGHNITDNYEEYRALPKKIRDAISLVEFIGLKKGRVGIGPRSKPRAMPKENGKDVPSLEGKNPSIVIKEEEEHSKLLGIEREQPMEALEVPITLPRDEPLTDFQDSSVKGHVFDEETMEHEPKKEGKYDAPNCGGELVVEAQSPGDNENTQLAGIFKTAAHKRQVDGVHDFGKNHEEAPCMCQQNMDEVKVGRASLVEYEEISTKLHSAKEDEQVEDNPRYDSENHISVFWSPPMSLPYLCHHGQLVEKNEPMSSLMLHSIIGGHHGQHSGNGDKVKNTLSGKGYIDPLSYKKDEVLNGFHVTMASECFISCIWLERNFMRNHMEFVVHSNSLVKDEMLQDGLIIPCTKRFQQLKLTLGKHMVSGDFYVNCNEDTDLVLGVPWLHSLGKFTQDYQTMELRFKLDGQEVVLPSMTNGIPQVATAKRGRTSRRRQDIWATHNEVKPTILFSKQQSCYKDFEFLIDKQALGGSAPIEVEVEFMNFVFEIERDGCYLVVPSIVTQLDLERHEEMILGALVSFNVFVLCVGTRIKKKEQLNLLSTRAYGEEYGTAAEDEDAIMEDGKFVIAKGFILHRNRVPPILGLGVKHKGFEEGTTQPRTAGRGQPRPPFGQPRRPLQQGNYRCLTLDQFCMMLKFAFPSLSLSEECNQELGNEVLSTPSEKGSVFMAAMSQTAIIDAVVIISSSPHLISVAFVFGNMECSSTLVDKDGMKNEDATLGHGLACQAADYSSISCSMTEITTIWKAFYIAEYAKEEVVTVVFEVEDEEDFNEERG
ncbi:hypothetical protein KI387_042630 [Taxus chinensis]|uniref:Uncharacterized protein n=1 Tax=Taxus chinensis TaxID=29808 RepID=A0AA38C3I8_TAXCH|nr:hypothetical protein KI387_042630 [Taxus chinensis]